VRLQVVARLVDIQAYDLLAESSGGDASCIVIAGAHLDDVDGTLA